MRESRRNARNHSFGMPGNGPERLQGLQDLPGRQYRPDDVRHGRSALLCQMDGGASRMVDQALALYFGERREHLTDGRRVAQLARRISVPN